MTSMGMIWADLVEAKGEDFAGGEPEPQRQRTPSKKKQQPEKTKPDPRTPAGCDVPDWMQDLVRK